MFEATFTPGKSGRHDLNYNVQVSTDLNAWTVPYNIQCAIDHPFLDPDLFGQATRESSGGSGSAPQLFM